MKNKLLSMLLAIFCAVCLTMFSACDLLSDLTNGNDDQSTEQTGGDASGDDETSENSGTAVDGETSENSGTAEDDGAKHTNNGTDDGDNTDDADDGNDGGGETSFAYADKTFDVYSGDMKFYIDDTTEWTGVCNNVDTFYSGIEVESYSLTFTFNSDGTGSYTARVKETFTLNSAPITAESETVINFNYTIAECTSLDIDYSYSAESLGIDINYSFSGSRNFSGYKFIFSDCTFAKYIITYDDETLGTLDVTNNYSDEMAETMMSMFAIGYNDSGMYLYAIESHDGDIYYTMYGKLAEVTE